MKTTKTILNFSEICRAVCFVVVIICMAYYGQAIQAGNFSPNNKSTDITKTVQSMSLSMSAYVYPNGYNISCFGKKDGSIDLTVSGGTAPFTYRWSNGASTQDLVNVPANYYSVTVTDAQHNTSEATITLTQPEPDVKPEIIGVVYEYNNGYNVSCNGCYNGSIDLTVIGGSGIYTYRWEDGPTTDDRYGLGGGNYNVVIKDASNCGNNQEFSRSYTLKEPPNNWTMDGNIDSDPPNQFIGTIDNKDLVFKTNDSLRLKINANGNVGIGTTNPVEKLTVGGNMLVDGKIITNRITSIDSLLYIGDSTMVINKNAQRIYTDGLGFNKGIAIGNQSFGRAMNSVGIGTVAITEGIESIAIGFRVHTSANKSIVIGSGAIGQSVLNNDIPNSLMVGFNSEIPTLFVGSSDGTTTGKVGIGTKTPQTKLDIFTTDEKIEIKLFTQSEKPSMVWTMNTSFSYGFGIANGKGYIFMDKNQIDAQLNLPNGVIQLQNKIMTFTTNGNVGIGTEMENNLRNYKLAVNGIIGAREVNVEIDNPIISWPDYVFDKKYDLMPLAEVEKYINTHKHLPDVQSASEIEKNGVALGENQALLLKKIEELTLYMIELNKQVEALKKGNSQPENK